MIMLVAQRDLEKEEPAGLDLYNYGTAASIMRMLKMPDGRIRILVQGLARASVTRFDENLPHLLAHILPLSDTESDADELEMEALIRNVRASLERAITLGKNISGEVMAIVDNLEDPGASRMSLLPTSSSRLPTRKACLRSSIPPSGCTE